MLGVETVEDNSINGNGNHLNHDFDETAHQAPILQPAHQRVVHLALEELATFVVLAAPAPDILTVAGRFAAMQDAGTHQPHSCGEEEIADGEYGVVAGGLHGATVPSSPVGSDDDDAEGQTDTRDDEHGDLRPGPVASGPDWEVVAGREVVSRVDDGEGCA